MNHTELLAAFNELSAECQEVIAERNALRAALRELVRLKALAEKKLDMTRAERQDYETNRGRAWDVARAALEEPQQ